MSALMKSRDQRLGRQREVVVIRKATHFSRVHVNEDTFRAQHLILWIIASHEIFEKYRGFITRKFSIKYVMNPKGFTLLPFPGQQRKLKEPRLRTWMIDILPVCSLSSQGQLGFFPPSAMSLILSYVLIHLFSLVRT